MFSPVGNETGEQHGYCTFRSSRMKCLYKILKHYWGFLGYHCNIAARIQKFTDSYIVLYAGVTYLSINSEKNRNVEYNLLKVFT